MQFEDVLVPAFFHSQNGKIELQRGFDLAVQHVMFCSVDVNKVLHEKQWRVFQPK
jgi:hypothetical protein